MKLSGWGRYPVVNANLHQVKSNDRSEGFVNNWNSFIPRGNGRSYGDSSLSETILSTLSLNHFLSFDAAKGFLTCEAGVLLSDILNVFLPRGWFPKVTPGTKLITIGGAIASDVHGKNHHLIGCFSESVIAFDLMLPTGEVIHCSRNQNVEWFRATCGGMGLTGIILKATIELKKVTSQFIAQTTYKTRNLEETFQAFELAQNESYSVAWIDCLSKGRGLGRSLLMVGDFIEDGNLQFSHASQKTIPFDFPVVTLNSFSVKTFNRLYYHKNFKAVSHQKVGFNTFFYPLDAIQNWNRIYGKNGFVQYQFILPKEASYKGLKEILEKIASSGMGSFLAVLKLYGMENENWLSFPLEGYSLALDFKMQPGLFELLDYLDDIVNDYGGRIYLAKDARISKEKFEKGYPKIDDFREFRTVHGLDKMIQSLQSKRLGL